MASLRLLGRADSDFDEAVAWYESRGPQVARRFEGAVTRALDQLARFPELYVATDGRNRLCPLRKFPFLIVYSYDTKTDEVVVGAIVHAKSDPRTW